MNFKNWLIKEVHWTDIYPKSFTDFRKKYNKISKSEDDLYVQFTNFANDTLIKTAYEDPTHTDPVGTYAYPLKYVMSHPADIWYGRSAKYLRVLRDTSKNKLILNYMDQYTARSILHKMGLNPYDFEYALKKFKYKSVNKIGQAFMSVVQMKSDQEEINGEHQMRTPKEQTKLFLKAGIDAIEDKSTRNTQAAINEREPEQIIFLRRDAFQVEEIVFLREDEKYINQTSPEEKEARKLASLVLQSIDGDNIVSANETPLEGTYWTKKGRRIKILFSRPMSYYTSKQLGEKKHKESKLHDTYHVRIIFEHSEKGEFEVSFSPNTKFKEIASDMKWHWNRKPSIPDFTPETKEQYLQRKKEEQEKRIKEKLAKEKKDRQTLYPKLLELFKIFEIQFNPKPNVDYVDILKSMQNLAYKDLSSNPEQNFEKLNNFWNKQAENYEKIKDDDFADRYIEELAYFPKDLSSRPDLAQLKQLFNKIHTTLRNINIRVGANIIEWALRELGYEV